MTELRKLSPFISGEALGSVPVGAQGKVYVEARNDMDTTQQFGISWRILDPDTIEVQDYSEWGLWPHTPPDKTHTFDGPTFSLDKVGTWHIGIGLYMNSDDPVQVDDYSGVLCVVKELEEFFAGTIVKKELVYDGVTDNIPVQ